MPLGERLLHCRTCSLTLSSRRLATSSLPCAQRQNTFRRRNERGRTEIRKVGLAPVQRDGIDYEFGTVFDLSPNHLANVSKDRTGIFDGNVFEVNQETGKKLRLWLEAGVSAGGEDNGR